MRPRLALWIAFSVSSLALGLLLLWLAPRALEAASWVARTATGPAIGAGLAAFFGLPAAAVLAIATIVGIPLGVALLLALLPLYAIGYATSAWLLGRGIVPPAGAACAAFLAGWGILRLVALIPWVGALAWFGATVFGLGALTIALWRARRGAVGPAGSAGCRLSTRTVTGTVEFIWDEDGAHARQPRPRRSRRSAHLRALRRSA